MKQILAILLIASLYSCENPIPPSHEVLACNLQDSVNLYKAKLDVVLNQLEYDSIVCDSITDELTNKNLVLQSSNDVMNQNLFFIKQRSIIQDSLMVNWYRDNPGVEEPGGELYGSLRGYYNEVNSYLNN